MKSTRKILVALIVVVAILMSMATLTFTASAADTIPAGTVLYLVPSTNWNTDNARFAAYFFGTGETWVSMTKVSGESNLYQVTVPEGSWTNVIFCRMDPNNPVNSWDAKWNQTADLSYNGSSNCYTVKEGTWDKGGGNWSTYGSTCLHTNLGPEATCTTPQTCNDCGDPVVSALGHKYDASHLCGTCGCQATFTVAGSGSHLGSEWDTGNTANDMTYADGVYTKVYTNVAAGDYELKCVRDHDWGTAYPQNADNSNYKYSVATSGSTVTVTLKGTTVDVVAEAPHVHNFVEGKCECGAEDPNYVPPHEHNFSNPTCTEAGKCECGETQGEALGHTYVEGVCSACGAEDPDYVPPHEHNFVEGKCECGETDPNYVAPVVNDKLINFSEWEPFAKETYADGDTFKYNDIFTFIYSKNSRVDDSAKTWDDFSGTLRFSFGGKTPTGSVPSKNALQITADGAYTLKIWYVAGGDGRYFALMDSTGAVLSSTTTETVKNGQYYAELEIPAAGTYYFGVPGDNNYIFQLELVAKASEPVDPPHEHNFVDGKCECGETDPNYVPPHVNTLVVGETNKIVVTGETLNPANSPIEWVLFTADEKAHYTFVGDAGVLAYIFSADGSTLISATGAADLEVGYYLICLGNGAVGEFNVAVTKSEIVEPPVEEHKNALVVGDNKFVITDAILGQFIEYIVFTAEADGKYTFTADEGSGFVFFAYIDPYSEEWAYTDPYVTNKESGENSVSINLKAGVYIVGVNYYYGGTVAGEYNVNVAVGEYEEGGNDVTTKNSITLGTNHYVVTDALIEAQAEWLGVYLEPGTYVLEGCSPLVVYVFYTAPDAVLSGTEPFVWNVDNVTYELCDKLVFTVTEAGSYWVGINFDYIGDAREFDLTLSAHEHNFVEGKCECGEEDPNYVPPHEHNFVDGKCECGETDPNYVPPVDDDPVDDPEKPADPETPSEEPSEEPAEELNFFQRIWKAIVEFFQRLFGKKD